MNRLFENVLVTGGAGIIGSNFIHYLFRQPEFSGRIVNYDALAYAGKSLEPHRGRGRVRRQEVSLRPQRYL